MRNCNPDWFPAQLGEQFVLQDLFLAVNCKYSSSPEPPSERRAEKINIMLLKRTLIEKSYYKKDGVGDAQAASFP